MSNPMEITCYFALMTTALYSQSMRRTDNSPSVSYDCQLRYRGAWSLNYEKKSFAVKLVVAKFMGAYEPAHICIEPVA